MKQKKEYIKKIESFKEKFNKLNENLEKLFNNEKNKTYIDYILKNKEKIFIDKKDFNFNTFFVDGSMSKIGFNYPNFLYIFRSFAFSPDMDIKIYMYDIFSPILEDDRKIFEDKLKEIEDSKNSYEFRLSSISYVEELLRYKNMAKVEIEVAKEALKFLKEKDILFMDGSLSHFEGEVTEEFNELRKSFLEKRVFLCGIIEDIGSKIIPYKVDDCKSLKVDIGDRELLINNLGIYEMLHIENPINKERYSITFLRLSYDPTPISIEIPKEMSYIYKEISSYLAFITQKHGRGIPIFRDMAHEGVKLTEKESLLITKNFINEEYIEKFFKMKRWLR
jgi:sRNA-binding carbon storage regulator CsrA